MQLLQPAFKYGRATASLSADCPKFFHQNRLKMMKDASEELLSSVLWRTQLTWGYLAISLHFYSYLCSFGCCTDTTSRNSIKSTSVPADDLSSRCSTDRKDRKHVQSTVTQIHGVNSSWARFILSLPATNSTFSLQKRSPTWTRAAGLGGTGAACGPGGGGHPQLIGSDLLNVPQPQQDTINSQQFVCQIFFLWFMFHLGGNVSLSILTGC